ncbi:MULTISPECIES: alpha/beta fold hydrolase [Azospira]|jgi:pimeloyl-ACP methyl ester carboxylesterase|uniref:Putative hydrolase or acyltransferase of alpha/beta superfamily n=1 Tax=Azospira oryzae (strain ATCC BAA-33 / DSM 13638 / PS) TaxID=640081 RepID=G8QKG4_AZOOP|nr:MULTISPECIES: alpha/beta hydrolase [Azospira]AEV26647.1 putative hydrolase or acyltransferase of alpha/beta superfamily [Azospira oryzae PS]MDK9692273.1 alpha/beta hydrolase [Azospira sp.]
MKPRQIHTLHRPAAKPNGQPPCLFVHGGYMDSRCWDVNFLPRFNAAGYDCVALDLSGHGQSEGRERLDRFGLDDYADDVLQVMAKLPRPPILIGHSMGCAVIERVLECQGAPAAVLLAPVPTSGTQGSIMSLALKHPDFFAKIPAISQGEMDEASLLLMRDIYFSPDMPPEGLLQFAHLIQPESAEAAADMAGLGYRSYRSRPELPVLVMGGQFDAVFPPSSIGFTALRWNGDFKIIPHCGHMLMLDHPWPKAAAEILQWLEMR